MSSLKWIGITTLLGASLAASGKHEGKKHEGQEAGAWVPPSGGQYVTAAPIPGCKTGYTLGERGCEQVVTAEGILGCPKHAELVGNECLRNERVGSVRKCPAGSVDTGAGCEIAVKTVPILECPKLWEMSPDGNQCMRRHKLKSVGSCEDGYALSRGTCVREEIYPSNMACPQGYVLSGEGKAGKCVMSEQLPPEVYCGKGWVADGGACVRLKERKKELENCPMGYDLQGGVCQNVVRENPLVTCPPGTALVAETTKHGGQCTSAAYMPVTPMCNKGFEFVNNRCQKAHKAQPSLVCPKHFSLTPDGRCHRETSVESDPQCPPNTVLAGKHCMLIEDAPVQAICPKGANLVQNRCVVHDIVAPRMLCPDGFRKSHQGAACRADHQVDSQLTCAEGRLAGKHCVVEMRTPAEPVCKKGQLGPDGCVEQLKKRPKMTCPNGYRKHKGQCARHGIIAPAFICPPDAILQERNQCLVTSYANPRFSCPKDWVLDHQHNCVIRDTAPPALACPLNTVKSGAQCFHAAFIEGAKKGKKGLAA